MLDRPGVLIVDIDHDHLRYCRALLEELDFRVFAASSAEAALMLGHDQQLLDLALVAADLGDGVTGRDVGQSLAKLGKTRKILLMSNEPLDGEACLRTPVTAEELLSILD